MDVSLTNKVHRCEVTHIPSVVRIPVPINPAAAANSRFLRRKNLFVCDRSIGKAIAAYPEDVDHEAGMKVPEPPSLSKLAHLDPENKAATMSVFEFLEEIEKRWEKVYDEGYDFEAIIVSPQDLASPILCNTKNLAFAHSKRKQVYHRAEMDEEIVCFYNTKRTAGMSDMQTNQVATNMLAQVDCMDIVYGSCLLVRRSLSHSVPLGLSESQMKQKLPSSVAPRTRIAKRRIRKRARQPKCLSVDDVGVESDEIVCVLVSPGESTATSSAIIKKTGQAYIEHLQMLLRYTGEFSYVPVKTNEKEGKEILVVIPKYSTDHEKLVCRNGSSQVFAFNKTAHSLFGESLTEDECHGPVLVVARNVESKRLVNYPIEFFEADFFRN